MSYWRATRRKIHGEYRAVKVRRFYDGREQVRILGYRNLVDRTARGMGRKRIPAFYNATDATRRGNAAIRKMLL